MFKALLCATFKPLAKVTYRVRVLGRENLPNPPFILAANHRSYLDPPLLLGFVSCDLRFIAKSELFKSPFIRPLLKIFSSIPVNRGKPSHETFKRAIEELNKGYPIGIFPEGTRTRKRLRAKTGVAFLAEKLNLPVVPVAIKGTERAFRFPPPRITIIIGEPLTYPPDISHREFAEMVLDRIYELLEGKEGRS